MAYSIEQKPNTSAPTAAEPYGNIKDDSGSNNGTPINKMVYADLHQYFARLMDKAGLEFNNSPDNSDNGFQLFDAIDQLNTRRDRQNFGYFSHEVTYTELPGDNNKITISENFAYIISGTGAGNYIIRKRSLTGSVLHTINSGSNPEFEDNASDVYYDGATKRLYVSIRPKDTGAPGVFDDGAGFLVYTDNEDDNGMTYQPSLSVPDSGAVNIKSRGLSVNDASIQITASTSSDSSGKTYSWNKTSLVSGGSVSYGSKTSNIYTNNNGTMIMVSDTDSGTYRMNTRMGGTRFHSYTIDMPSSVFVAEYDRYTNRMYVLEGLGNEIRLMYWDMVNDLLHFNDTMYIESTGDPLRGIYDFCFFGETMVTVDDAGVWSIYKRTLIAGQ